MRISSVYITPHGSIPVAPWQEASCILEGSGQGGWYCRVHGDFVADRLVLLGAGH